MIVMNNLNREFNHLGNVDILNTILGEHFICRIIEGDQVERKNQLICYFNYQAVYLKNHKEMNRDIYLLYRRKKVYQIKEKIIKAGSIVKITGNTYYNSSYKLFI